MYDFNAYQAHVLSHAKVLPLRTDLQHVGLGLISEAGEINDALKAHMIYDKPIDILNIVEECGDGMWFASLGARLMTWDFENLSKGWGTGGAQAEDRVIGYGFKLADAAAAYSVRVGDHVDYGTPIDLGALRAELGRYVSYAAKIASCYGFPLAVVCDVNKAKLDYRYNGAGFDAAKGLNRNKAEERAVMQAVLDAHQASVAPVA